MTDLMLTGRLLDAEESLRDGLAVYLVDSGQGLDKALEPAKQIANNSPVINYAILHALPRIAETDPETGLLMESLMAAVALSSPETKQRVNDFLTGKSTEVVQR